MSSVLIEGFLFHDQEEQIESFLRSGGRYTLRCLDKKSVLIFKKYFIQRRTFSGINNNKGIIHPGSDVFEVCMFIKLKIMYEQRKTFEHLHQ